MSMNILGTELTGVLGVALAICGFCVVVALLAAAWRLLRGPSLADRVVALDMITMLLVVFLVVFALASGVRAYVYAAIGLALIGFLATVAFAHYIERAAERRDD
jgi:multicomponent Na+:H+ antiporter subunit F